MRSDWRSGFGIGGSVAAAAPIVALVLIAVAQLTTESGDIREGLFPWFFAFAGILFAACCMGLLAVHSPYPGGWMLVGSWWVALGFLGIAGGFTAIAVGSVLGISEDAAGALASLPMIGLGFGFVSMTPALAIAAIGARKKRVLPAWGRATLWLAAPLVPLLLIYGGLVEDTAETVGSSIMLGLIALAWIMIGLSIRTAESKIRASPNRT